MASVGGIIHRIRAAKAGHGYAETVAYGLSVILAKLAASALYLMAGLLGLKYKAPSRVGGARKDRMALVMPIMPDLSHHFLYREGFRLLDRFDLRVFTIFKGAPEFGTAETRALGEVNEYYPEPGHGRARFYMAFVKRALRDPLGVANLLLLYKGHMEREGIKFVSFGAINDFCHPLYGFTLTELIEPHDVSHIHAYCSNVSTNHALVAAHLLRKGLSFTGYVDFDFYYSFKMLREKMEFSDFMVVHTAFCKERMLQYVGREYEGKLHVVRIGLDFAGLTAAPHRSDDSVPRLVAICGLVEKKGLRYLIEACGIIRKEVHDFRLYVIGDGPLMKDLVRQARELNLEDRVVFVGGLPNQRVFDYLTEDSVLVMPSVYTESGERDGIPTVIIEAMAQRVNVVSTRVSGIPEVVEDGVNGLLVEPGDPSALADAILRLHRDRELFERLRMGGRPKVTEMFDIRKNAGRLAELITKSMKV